MRPDAKYHDEPCSMPFQGQNNCTMCPQTTRWMCWGCNLELGEVFPVCSPSTGRNCFAEMHKLRTDIWYWIFYDTDTKNEYVHTLNMKNIMRLIGCKYVENFICWMKKRFIASTPHAPHIRQDTREETINQWYRWMFNIYTKSITIFICGYTGGFLTKGLYWGAFWRKG